MSDTRKYVINIRQITLFFCFAIFFPPNIVEMVPFFNAIDNVLRVIAVGLMMIFFFTSQIILSKTELLTVVFLVYGLIDTAILSPSNIGNYISGVVFRILGTILIYQLFILEDPIECVHIWAFYSRILILLNFFVMIMFPKGLVVSAYGSAKERANWLLGSKNSLFYMALLISLFLVVDYLYFRRKSDIFAYFVLIISMAMAGDNGLEIGGGSVAGLLSIAVLTILILVLKLDRRRMLSKLLSRKNVILLSAMSFAVIFIIAYKGNSISFVDSLTSMVGKSSNFSGRLLIWNKTIGYILKSPFWGYGYGGKDISFVSGSLVTKTVYSLLGRALFYYGIIGLSLILLIYITSSEISNDLQMICEFVIDVYILHGIVNVSRMDYLLFIVLLENGLRIVSFDIISSKNMDVRKDLVTMDS